MRLSWNEIRARAAAFSKDWREASYEKGETQSFYNDFFGVFGIKRRSVARYEERVKLLDNKHGYIDLFWPGTLLVEQKSAGRDLRPAKGQALDYFEGVKAAEHPRYVLLSDFQSFELYDLDLGGPPTCFQLADLPAHVEAFGFMIGVERRVFRDADPANVEAAELMGRLHDALEATGYRGHDLERLLVRLVFCLFADGTRIFDAEAFQYLVRERTSEDGSDVGPWLSHLFEVLNTHEDSRQTNLDSDLAKFPYINGELFAERLPPASFNASMRRMLIEACEFRWAAVSPAVFGSLFQSVMNPEERRKQGAHYTSERDILKVIHPLFLDELMAEFDRAKSDRSTGRRNRLGAFHDKLASLTFFDPACGCGNFLVLAYRELRALEIEVLKELNPEGQRELDVHVLSRLDVNQFYGVELDEFAGRIAEVALWLTDHIMNNELSLAFGEAYARIPLKASPTIRCADALEIDWTTVLPAERCSYVLGNPPFRGAKFQSAAQRAQVRRIAGLAGSGGTLDYVSAWFLVAGAYVQTGRAKIGFVSTNSITQGEQVAQLWPLLFARCQLEITFAHRTFAWRSEARGMAHVHVVIIGLARRDQEPAVKRLFSYSALTGDPVESRHSVLSPYLFDASQLGNRHLVIQETSRSLSGAPKMVIGSKPIDGGYLIFDDAEKAAFLVEEPGAAKYLRPFIGGVEYIQGRGRWILALQSASPAELRAMPAVIERLKAVRLYREGKLPPRRAKPGAQPKTPGISARALADMPTQFHVTVLPQAPFLAVPENSSETREYLPIGWLEPPTIPSNKLRFIKDADLWHFGVLTSRMHMAWLRYIGGRIKSDFQYSIGIVYNAFPWPEASKEQIGKVRTLARAVLDARALHPTETLADLYDNNVMRPDLRKAHRALDLAVDRLYRAVPFASDRERVEHLFARYEQLVSPLTSQTAPRRRRRRELPAAAE